jgi:hypothetical protein
MKCLAHITDEKRDSITACRLTGAPEILTLKELVRNNERRLSSFSEKLGGEQVEATPQDGAILD